MIACIIFLAACLAVNITLVEIADRLKTKVNHE